MTVNFTEAAKLEDVKTGEKLSTLFGKIKKAISTLILHLKAENPHQITASKISAAAANHAHYVSGVFTGNGTQKRLISLDFTPSAVILCNGRGMTGDDIDGVCGGIAVGAHGLRSRQCTVVSHETTWSNSDTALLITTNGFYVNYYSSTKVSTNKSGETYRYIAFK